MKQRILIISVALLLLGCSEDNSLLQGEWIEKYEIDSENNFKIFGKRRIFSFDEKELEIRNFFFESEMLAKESIIKEISYEKTDNYLVLEKDGEKDTILIHSQSKDSLDLVIRGRRSVFQKVNGFNHAKNKNRLIQELENSRFLFNPRNLEIEFFRGNYFLVDKLDVNITSNQYWKIESYKDELFLVTDGYAGSILQLKGIKQDTINFQSYSLKNEEIKLVKRNEKTKRNRNDLIGHWEEENIVEPPLIGSIENGFYKRENLVISDSLLQKKKYRKDEEFYYFLNRNCDMLVFPANWDEFEQRCWKIEFLDEKTLIIKRLKKYRNFGREQLETVKYFKKK